MFCKNCSLALNASFLISLSSLIKYLLNCDKFKCSPLYSISADAINLSYSLTNLFSLTSKSLIEGLYVLRATSAKEKVVVQNVQLNHF